MRDRGPFWPRALRALLGGLALAALLRVFALEVVRVPSGSMAPTVLLGDRLLVVRLAYGLRLPGMSRPLFQWSEPRRGEVVVFASPSEPGRRFVKRVVGVGGDVVAFRGETLVLNGVPQPRLPLGPSTYEDQGLGALVEERCPAFEERLDCGAQGGEPSAPDSDWRGHRLLQCGARPGAEPSGEGEHAFARVKPRHLFVLGDNRDRSRDSREGGGWQLPLELVEGRAVVAFGRSGAARAGRPPVGVGLGRLFKPIE